MAPLSIELIKRMAYAGLETPLAPQLDVEAYYASILLETEDFKEGVQAFKEERQTVCPG